MTDDDLTALAAEYMGLIAHDHHKDRDCHWEIVKRWSYGEAPQYFVAHMGYCYEGVHGGEAGPYPTIGGAMEGMVQHLRMAIRAAKEWHEG